MIPLGQGQDNVVYQVDDLILRFAQGPSDQVTREARLLALVGSVSPLPVPVPVFTDPATGCLAYRKLPGTPLIDLRPARWTPSAERIAATLGELLSALHAVPAEQVAGLVEVDDLPLSEWLGYAAESCEAIGPALPARHRPAVSRFLADPPPGHHPGPPVFSHNDLGSEHVLVDPETLTVTGVIDWTDAALTDPAHDLGRLHRDLGPAAITAALHHFPPSIADSDPGIRERAEFYARCTALEDLAYGLETEDDRYCEQALRAIERLFPGQA